MLPEEVLQIIFKQLLRIIKDDKELYDIKYLLNCRLVCWSWKNAVDNCPALITTFCCTVSSIPEFLTSTIATKVKKLRFVNGLSSPAADQEQLDTFFKEIIPNVDKIVFDFPGKSKYSKNHLKKLIKSISPAISFTAAGQQRMLFLNLMKTAKNLQEIRIHSSNRLFLKRLNPEQIQLVGSNVKTFFLNVDGLERNEIPMLKDLLLSMPNLCKVVFIHELFKYLDRDVQRQLLNNVILAHIHSFPGSLKVNINLGLKFYCNCSQAICRIFNSSDYSRFLSVCLCHMHLFNLLSFCYRKYCSR